MKMKITLEKKRIGLGQSILKVLQCMIITFIDLQLEYIPRLDIHLLSINLIMIPVVTIPLIIMSHHHTIQLIPDTTIIINHRLFLQVETEDVVVSNIMVVITILL